MKTVIVAYDNIRPEDLAHKVGEFFPSAVRQWKRVDTDYYELTIKCVNDLAKLEDILAKWV